MNPEAVVPSLTSPGSCSIRSAHQEGMCDDEWKMSFDSSNLGPLILKRAACRKTPPDQHPGSAGFSLGTDPRPYMATQPRSPRSLFANAPKSRSEQCTSNTSSERKAFLGDFGSSYSVIQSITDFISVLIALQMARLYILFVICTIRQTTVLLVQLQTESPSP